MASSVSEGSKALKSKRDRMEDHRWIKKNLLTFRWCLVSSVGFGAFEVARVAHHSILDLIPPAMKFFYAGDGSDGRV